MADVSIRVGLDVGGLLANSARGVSAIKEIERAMDAAQKKGDVDLVGHLAYEKDKLQGGMFRYNQEVKAFSGSAKFQEYQTALAKGDNVSRFTNDHEFVSRLKTLDESNKALAQALDELRDSVEKGDFKQIQQANTSVGQEINKAAGQITAPESGDAKALASFLNVQTAQQVIGAVSSGIKTYISHLDRSSIINQQGSGDIVGAEIADLRRDAVEKSTFWGSIGRIGGGIIPGILGTVLSGGNPLVGAAAAQLGSSFFGALGDHAGSGDEAESNRMATKEALSQQWQSQAPAAMELAGILGRYGGSDDENTSALRDAFSRAAGMANEYGYSVAEGIEAVKQGAAQGLGEGEAIAAAKSAFAFERGTGADRASLLELETRARRFGIDNMIGAAWQGNQASGMSTGQFNEFLRSMQRVFEDGISKGFVRGGQEIAGNLAYISALGGESELFKGESGANIMQSIGGGFAGATSLSSVTDMIVYQSGQSLIEKWKNSEDPAERKKYDNLFDLDGDGKDDISRNATSWGLTMRLMEKGFDVDLFNETMTNFNGIEGGSYDDMVGRIVEMSQGELTKTQAQALLYGWEKNGKEPLSETEYKDILAKYVSAVPASGSTELDFEKMTQRFITEIQTLSQKEFDIKADNLPDLIKSGVKGIEDILAGSPPPPLDPSGMPPLEAEAAAQAEFKAAVEAGDFARADRATIEAEKARIAALNPDYGALNPANIDRQIIRAPVAGNDFFSNGFLFKSDEQKADTAANKKLTDILNGAVTSGDATQVQQATMVMDIFDRVPRETKEKWDRDNKLNTKFADSRVIDDILTALKKLVIISEENGKMNVTVRSEEG